MAYDAYFLGSQMNKTAWRTLFLICLTGVLLVIGLPWSQFDGTPHWENVYWIPFSGPVRFHPKVIFEIVGNVMLFVPVGYSFIRSVSSGIERPLLWAAGVGLASSLSVEAYELFCRYRAIETADLILNTAGTLLGALMAFRFDVVALNLLSRRMQVMSSTPNTENE
jgi:glycopeptide antibiotics resistance protein